MTSTGQIQFNNQPLVRKRNSGENSIDKEVDNDDAKLSDKVPALNPRYDAQSPSPTQTSTDLSGYKQEKEEEEAHPEEEGYKEGIMAAYRELGKQEHADQSKIGQKEGEKEVSKERKKSGDLANSRLEGLIQNKNPIYKLHTKMPLDLFPDEISIELKQVGIISRHFMYTERHSIPIQDIVDVELTTDLFFATIVVQYKETVENSLSISNHSLQISFLNKDEAKKARRIIDGLLLAQKEGIDLLAVSDDHLIEKIEQIGHVQD